jgi:hypothetical protein
MTIAPIQAKKIIEENKMTGKKQTMKTTGTKSINILVRRNKKSKSQM